MTDINSLEQQVREVLATETDAIRLSDALFRPDGLFARMASSKEDRRQVAKSTLFKDAQERLAELRRREAREFSVVVEKSQHDPQSGPPRLHRVERV